MARFVNPLIRNNFVDANILDEVADGQNEAYYVVTVDRATMLKYSEAVYNLTGVRLVAPETLMKILEDDGEI